MLDTVERMRRLSALRVTLVVASASAALLLAMPAARADDDAAKPRYGLFELGLHVEGGLGFSQTFGSGGIAPGLYPRGNLELELSNAFAIPLIFRLQPISDPSSLDLSQISVAPGILFRFRGQESILAFGIGAGVRIGSFSVNREIVGFTPSQDPGTQRVTGFPFAPEGGLRLELWPSKWLTANVGVTYSPIFTDGGVVHTIEESAGAAIVF